MRVLKKTLLLFCLLSFSFIELKGESFTLCDKFKNSSIGDYIVTEQDKNYSILLVKSKSPDAIVFEEITIPQSAFEKRKLSWQTYLNENAPEHTSWVLFELSLKTGEVIECYSLAQRSWISFDDSEHFLSKFFVLPLSIIPNEERRKIGPPPQGDENDRRSLWNPPLFFQGKKVERPSFDARKARWVNDGSIIAGSRIEMFFNAQDSAYPFPVWIEVNNGHYGFKIRAFDTGKGLISPIQKPMPRRPPLIAGNFSLQKNSVELPIQCPSYAKEFSVSLIEVLNPLNRVFVNHTLVNTDRKELYILKLDKKQLYQVLTKGSRYKLAITPKGQNIITIETDESFLLP